MTDTPLTISPLATSVTEERLIDLIAEELQVTTQVVETGKVEITKRVVTEEVAITAQHLDHTIEVQRVAVNQIFDTAPAPVRELPDGTIVYSVVREVPVVVTQFELIEEIHVRPVRTARDEHYVMPVRREHIDVTRTSNPDATSKPTRHDGGLV